ncbi:MAG: O-antigen ligase family protein [Candidatus Moranbacteria bacterium]|nr:O-antigen ligase family protein [Candidatus Moranbacteria bacterium]
MSTFAFLGWFFWSTLSFVWAIDPGWSYRKIFFLINFLLLFIVLIGQKETTFKRIFRWYVGGAVGISSVAILQSLLQLVVDPGVVLLFWTEKLLPFFLGSNFAASVATYPSLLVNILGKTYFRATGFFPDPHIFSYYVAMAIPFTCLYWKKNFFGWSRLVSLLLFLGLLLSFSRGGYVAIAASFLWFLLLIFFFEKKQKIALWIIAASSISLFALVSPVGNRFISSFTSGDGSRSERVQLAYTALEAIRERPFLGVGVGNYPLWVKPEALSREPIYAHNLYLDIAAELGLVGLSLFLIAVFGALFESFQKWKLSKDPFYLALHIALVYFLVHGFFEAPIFSVHVLPVFLLIIAACFVKSDIKT